MGVSPPGWHAHVSDHDEPSSFDPRALTAEGTLVHAWRSRWSGAPGRPVLHDAASGWITSGEFDARSRSIAGALGERGAAAGVRVMLSGASSIDLVSVYIALLRLGAIVVPVNGAYRAREVQHIARDCGAALAITDHPEWPEWLAGMPVLAVGDAAQPAPAAGVARAAPDQLDCVQPRTPALIGYTSGTTGSPKGAVLSHANLLASAAALARAWRWTSDDRLVLCLPLFHAHGLCVGLHGTLYCGASAVLLDGFHADTVLDAARDHRGTMFFGVPTMYHRLADSPRAGELASLRLCVSGSAPLPAALHGRLAATTGQAILERYGMTETVMLISNPYRGERRAGSVGLPLPGVEVALARGEGEPRPWHEAAGDGEVGEILVRGPNVFAGYWERPDANAASFVDGWFRTGDLATIASDGYVTIVGRAKELIISGGYNVYPREVEDVLAGHPALADVAVVGAPSDEWGEEVVAFAVLAPGATAPSLGELREFARGALANYKLPRRLELVDALPRNALGKVVKGELPTPKHAAR